MGQASNRNDKETLDVVIINALIVDWWGIVKADIGIKEGMIVGIGKAGNPDIMDGVTPGMGGSIRLTKAVGKAKALDMVLTGRMIDAAEADRIGLVSRVVEHDALMDTAMGAAKEIAGYSIPSIMAAKEMVGRALEVSTAEGVKFERRLFQGLFGTADQKEGMAAFTEKRAPDFKDK